MNVESVSFGPFRLVAKERLLMRGTEPVALCGRALDLLIVLAAHPNQIISKKDLLATVWPDVVVEEGSLRVHIAALRKALGDGQEGARYISTVPGRGYCFVATVSEAASLSNAAQPKHLFRNVANVPPRLLRLVGRTEAVELIARQVATSRFISIVGPGGVGKTTVAVAAAHDLKHSFAGAVVFVDLGTVGDPAMVASSVSAMFDLPTQTPDPLLALITSLREQRFLLVLDNCEHVIDAAATLTERIWRELPQAHILATSREALRVEGEKVYRLPPLELPPDDPSLTAANALTYPAIKLFVERAVANDIKFDFQDDDVATVVGICRRLDGMALAIELAAGRVAGHGLRQTAALLDERLTSIWLGRRTAPPRQKTLQATLDWSHDLLSGAERIVLRRLGILVGNFTLDAARAVVVHSSLGSDQVVASIDSLIEKSMLVPVQTRLGMQYRLLETTRAYARAKLLQSGEVDAAARLHAVHYVKQLQDLADRTSEAEQTARHAEFASELGNVRAALEWTLRERGDIELGIELAATSATLFIRTGLLEEYRQWLERALDVLPIGLRDGRWDMELHAAYGHCLMFTRGNGADVQAALLRAAAIAQASRDSSTHLRVLTRLHMLHRRAGRFADLLPIAAKVKEIAATIGDPAGISAAHLLLGVAHHLTGNQQDALDHLESALTRWSSDKPRHANEFGFHGDPAIPLARVLWLRGKPGRAVALARRTTAKTSLHSDPVVTCIALVWGASVFRWAGEWSSVENCAQRLLACARQNSLQPFIAVGEGVHAELSAHRGNVEAGLAILAGSLAQLRAENYGLYTAELGCAYVATLIRAELWEDALKALLRIEAAEMECGHSFMTPEVLRLKGACFRGLGRHSDAKSCLEQSILRAAEQFAPAWQLRATIDLARSARGRLRREKACSELHHILTRFDESDETPDLRAARSFLKGEFPVGISRSRGWAIAVTNDGRS